MTQRTITALYDTREAADAAKMRLTAMDIPGSDVSVHDEGSAGGMASTGDSTSSGGGGMIAGLKNLFGSHDDSHAYAEGLRRGHFLLTAKVDEMKTDAAVQTLETTGAVDLDTKEDEWKQSGWSAPAASGATTSQAMTADRDAAIPVVEERLVVGKREVERGGVRVRSYVVETPVEEQVSLRDEHVDVERRVVDRPVGAGEDAFRERTLEMTETGEEAVVGKQAYVTEEIDLKKDVGQRTEEVRDTVRHTEVDVERTGTADAASKTPRSV